MNRTIAIFVSTLAAAFVLVTGGEVCAAAAAAATEAPTFKVGDKVVATWPSGNSYLGTVKEAAADGLTIAWDGESTGPFKVVLDHIYALPKNEKRPLKARTLALCFFTEDKRWYDCKVTKVTDKGASVIYNDGSKGTVTWAQIIVPTGTAAEELAERFEGDSSGGGGSGGGGSTASASSSGSDDGALPTLKNEDSEPHDYSLECVGTTNTSIGGSTSTTLSKGCKLTVNGTTVALRGNMSCVIRGGSLSCN